MDTKLKNFNDRTFTISKLKAHFYDDSLVALTSEHYTLTLDKLCIYDYADSRLLGLIQMLELSNDHIELVVHKFDSLKDAIECMAELEKNK